jgi:hypothetical protein
MKRKRKERERRSGTLVPLRVAGRRWDNLLIANPVVTRGRIRFLLFLKPPAFINYSRTH